MGGHDGEDNSMAIPGDNTPTAVEEEDVEAGAKPRTGETVVKRLQEDDETEDEDDGRGCAGAT